jgi:hypothetical protein
MEETEAYSEEDKLAAGGDEPVPTPATEEAGVALVDPALLAARLRLCHEVARLTQTSRQTKSFELFNEGGNFVPSRTRAPAARAMQRLRTPEGRARPRAAAAVCASPARTPTVPIPKKKCISLNLRRDIHLRYLF